jgi:hypothetical protein
MYFRPLNLAVLTTFRPPYLFIMCSCLNQLTLFFRPEMNNCPGTAAFYVKGPDLLLTKVQ